MKKYIIRRLLHMIPVMLLLSMIVFSLLRLLPGDPIFALIGEESEGLTPELKTQLRHQLGLDRPVPVQYALWLGDVFQGDWGRSMLTKRPVSSEVFNRLAFTFQLGILAWVFSLVIALPAGVISAVKRNSPADIVVTLISIVGIAVPHFWLGMMLILTFGVFWPILPTHGAVSLLDNPAQGLRHLVLPIITLGLGLAAINMRQTRSAMLEVLREDYIRTARAKGLQERAVIWIHAIKNALLPVVTVAGLQFGRIFGGAVITETIFSLPGVGRLAVESVLGRDYTMVQMSVMVMGLAVLIANLVTDLTYAYLDPRIRYG
ncbi:MAG: ABC transporter permease [Chloroflexi bacterium]|nr:ABC transporter permease [Chloroflexota bacterium]